MPHAILNFHASCAFPKVWGAIVGNWGFHFNNIHQGEVVKTLSPQSTLYKC